MSNLFRRGRGQDNIIKQDPNACQSCRKLDAMGQKETVDGISQQICRHCGFVRYLNNTRINYVIPDRK